VQLVKSTGNIKEANLVGKSLRNRVENLEALVAVVLSVARAVRVVPVENVRRNED
jgi:hypothetical protein